MVTLPRRLGLLGGMSWESTTLYYQLINRGIADRLGGVHSADLVDRAAVDRVIYDELIHGVETKASRDTYCAIIGRLAAAAVAWSLASGE